MICDHDFQNAFSIMRKSGHAEPMRGFHSHQRNELILVREGGCTAMTETVIKRITGPCAIFYPAGVAHHQVNDDKQPYIRTQILYTDAMLANIIPTEGQLWVFSVVPLSCAHFERIESCIRMLHEWTGDGEDNRRARGYLLGLIFGEILSAMKQLPTDQNRRRLATDDQLRAVCRYVYDHCDEHITIEALAQRFFLSRSKLTRMFTTSLGVTVMEYVNGVRVSTARGLLLERYTLSEISEKCGFSSTGYFIKVFRRRVGMTPGEYRRQMRHKIQECYSDIQEDPL